MERELGEVAADGPHNTPEGGHVLLREGLGELGATRLAGLPLDLHLARLEVGDLGLAHRRVKPVADRLDVVGDPPIDVGQLGLELARVARVGLPERVGLLPHLQRHEVERVGRLEP